MYKRQIDTLVKIMLFQIILSEHVHGHPIGFTSDITLGAPLVYEQG